jgi:cyclopropane fatty-acyl-phospholipid synthase-like methyltransferase
LGINSKQRELVDSRPDIVFFVEAAMEAGSPVLEVGCRTIRVLIPTARAGIDIVGHDLSPYTLTVCRERLQDEGRDLRLRYPNKHKGEERNVRCIK